MPVILRGVVEEEEDRWGGERMEEGLEKEEVCDGGGGRGEVASPEAFEELNIREK